MAHGHTTLQVLPEPVYVRGTEALFQTLLRSFINSVFSTGGPKCFNAIWTAVAGTGGNPDLSTLIEISDKIDQLAASVQGIQPECVYLKDYHNANARLAGLQGFLNQGAANFSLTQWQSILDFLDRGASDTGSDYFSLMAALMYDVYAFDLNICFEGKQQPMNQAYGAATISEAYQMNSQLISGDRTMLLNDYVEHHIKLALTLAGMAAAFGQTGNICYNCLLQGRNRGLFNADGIYSSLSLAVNGILNDRQVSRDLLSTLSDSFFPAAIFSYLKFAPLTLCQQAYIIYLELSAVCNPNGGSMIHIMAAAGSDNYLTPNINNGRKSVLNNNLATAYTLDYTNASQQSLYCMSLTDDGNSNSIVNIAGPQGLIGIVQLDESSPLYINDPFQLVAVSTHYDTSDCLCDWTLYVTQPSWASQPVFVCCNKGYKGHYLYSSTADEGLSPSHTVSYSGSGSCQWYLTPLYGDQTIASLNNS